MRESRVYIHLRWDAVLEAENALIDERIVAHWIHATYLKINWRKTL